MKILSIDTSSKLCAIAVLENSKLIKEYSLDNGLTHSEKLMPMICDCLKNLNLKISDFDLFVCDKGPGSFTGIRIGVATVKAFSDSLNIPSIGISSLETLAYNVKEKGLICSLIDAKNNSAYWCLSNLSNDYSLETNFEADTISDILNKLPMNSSPITFVGDGTISYKEEILNKFPNARFSENNEISAYNLGLIGLKYYKNKIESDVLPLYLRKSQAERILEEKQNGNK